MLTSMSNGAYSTLASGITSGATSLSVANGEGARFPASNFYVSVYDSIHPNWAVAYRNGAGEIMLCSSRSTDTFTVTRAQGGTSAVAFNTTGRTYRVEQNPTAEAFEAATASVGGVVSTIAQTFAGVKNFINNLTVGQASTTLGNLRLYNTSNAYTTDIASGLPSGDVILTLPTTTGTLVPDTKETGTILTTQFYTATNFNGGARFMAPFNQVSAYTTYAGIGSGTVPIFKVPYAGVLHGFTFTAGQNSLNSGTTFTVTVYVNGVATALTMDCTHTTVFTSDTTHTVSVAAGDDICFHRSALSGGSSGTVGAECYSVYYRRTV